MNITKRIRDPKFLVNFHAWATIFFVLLTIPTFLFKWYESIGYVSILSVWALVASHWSAYSSARAEEKIDKKDSND